MKPTDDESANLKQRLRTEAVTDALRDEAQHFPAETSEAIEEVERGMIAADPDSYVAEVLRPPGWLKRWTRIERRMRSLRELRRAVR